MTIEEIREVALNSAQTYYDYLDNNDKGIQEVDVYEIEVIKSKDLILKLRLSAKLFDIESIFFKLLTKNLRFDTSQIKIIEYDSDKNNLLIKPDEDLVENFINLNSHDLKVISDLKFLVQRIKYWYEQNGSKISLPSKPSLLKTSIDEMRFLDSLQPSENQKESLRSIFINPFTYVWGAPGTGKTMFVLSYAVLHYLKKNKRVAILAPTNNSIEQVLRGVISMTDKANIDRKQILRLGTPSKKFAESYPEICEVKGVQKKLDEVDNQISILERVITYNESKEVLNGCVHKLELFNKFDLLEYNFNAASQKMKNFEENKKKKEIEIKYLTNDLNNLKTKSEKAIRSIDSLSHKFKKFFSSEYSEKEKERDQLIDKIILKEKEIEFAKYQFSELEVTNQPSFKIHRKIANEVQDLISTIKKDFDKFTTLKTICSYLSISNWKDIKDQLVSSIENEFEIKEIDANLSNEYSNYSPEALKFKLNEYANSRSKLTGLSTDERLTSVNVIACTLDGYIGKFTDTKMKVEHIFVDEASYANVIKALTLFNHSVPITFLGDHKQLPPVCEINDVKIQREEDFHNMYLWAQSAIFIETLFNSSNDSAINQYLNNTPFVSNKLKMTTLNSTYRFGINLANILNEHVYDESFTSSNSVGETKIIFVHAKKHEEPKSRISMKEVEAVINITKQLKKTDQNDYVILTPYKKQVKLLGTHLPEDRNELRILTVHGSQGREWDTVILSVVDTDDKWFVDSKIQISKGLNLVNTAISRAKKQLIIVCDKNYWIEQDGQLITDLIKNGSELLV